MNKIYETENLFLKELDKSSARQVLDYYMRNKAFLEEWEIIRNEEFYTLNFQEKMLEEEARYIENKNLVKLWLFKKDEEKGGKKKNVRYLLLYVTNQFNCIVVNRKNWVI